MSFLVDTDICSAYLKAHAQVTSRFLQYTGRLHISTVTLGELFTWALRANAPPQRLISLTALMKDVTVLEVTADVARKFGEIRAALLDGGRPAPSLDLMIAATALAHNLTLVSHNAAHYVHVPGLTLADWLIP